MCARARHVTSGAESCRRLWTLVIENSLLLVAGTVLALVWANLAHDSYEDFTHALHFVVNDIGMVFFFAIATKEIIEATLPGGALASPREAGVPILAALGGMAGPAGLYTLQVQALSRPALAPGWAIPCATDIAFSYMVARLIFPKNHAAIPFLLLLAIADDAFGLMLLAIFYPSGELAAGYLAVLIGTAVTVAFGLRRRRVQSFWPYVLIAGSLSWAGLFLGGLHPALALVPVLPFMPHEPRDLGPFDRREHELHDTLNRFEHWWKVPVQVVLFFFGLVNAGVAFSSIGDGTWLVVSSLLVGKPLGILLLTAAPLAVGLRAPGGLSYRHTFVVGLTAGIGFTVALFFATAAFPSGELLEQAKMGALLSFAAAPIAVAAGKLLGVAPKPSRTVATGATR